MHSNCVGHRALRERKKRECELTSLLFGTKSSLSNKSKSEEAVQVEEARELSHFHSIIHNEVEEPGVYPMTLCSIK